MNFIHEHTKVLLRWEFMLIIRDETGRFPFPAPCLAQRVGLPNRPGVGFKYKARP